MKQRPSLNRRRTAALLAAAAFLFTPSFAQDAPAQEAQQPPVIAAPPVQTPPPAEKQPVVDAPEVPASADEALAEEARPAARTAPRAAVRPPVAAPRPAAAVAAAPAAEEAFAPAPAAVAPPPVAAPVAPLPTEVTVQPLPVPSTDPVTTSPAAASSDPGQPGGSMLPWIIVGALVLGALALFAMRRRPQPVYREAYREPAIAAAPVAAPAPILREAQGDRPWIELLMQPARAGIEAEDAVVEFVLTVDNQGSAPADDVRISTWLVAGGPNQGSEMERMLAENACGAALPNAIPAGEGRSIQTQVALSTASIEGDTILPVVVADARYTLPDGTEGRTSASFAVGVPDGEELAHFGIANPSGLHEGVIARPLGEPERA